MKDPKRQAAGRKSSRKGKGNERALAKLFRDWWGHGEWARTPLSGGWASKDAREGFRTCGDIITTAADFPFCIEAKKQEGWTLDQLIHNDKCIIFEWWNQAVSETPVGMIPLLVMARNHIPQAVAFAVSQVEPLMLRHCPELMEQMNALPWEAYPSLHFWRVGDKFVIVIVSLENFLKINPDFFGRRLLNAEPTTGTGTTEAIG